MSKIFNKKTALTVLGFAALSAVSASIVGGGKVPERIVQKNAFGAMEVTDFHENGSSKTVYLPFQKNLAQDYERMAHHLSTANRQDKINKERMTSDRVYKCDNRLLDNSTDIQEAGYFIPVEVGTVGGNKQQVGQTLTFQNGLCFQNATFSISYGNSKGNDFQDVTINIDLEKPRSYFCSDWFLFGNAELQHVETFYLSGKHQVTLTNLSPQAATVIANEGLQIFMFCDGYVDTFMSVYNTLQAFLGGLGTDPNTPIFGSHVPEYMEKENVKFLNDTMGYSLQVRDIQEYEYDESLIQSGDFFAVTRLDGVDPIIMYGSGTHSGHSVMALRFDDGLYIIESQDGWYWPRHGIQRNKFSQWIEWAKNADFHVVHMPLNAEARAKFNETAAREFFAQTEGLPYGYHNFLFGWIDTPVDNWPPLLPSGFIPIVFSVLESFTPSTVDIFLNQALNKRLNTTGLNLKEIAAEAALRNLTIEDLMAMVEVEGWEYTGLPNDGRAYVCSAYVAAVYRAAGIFGNMTVYGPEFTPKDVYTLAIFDTEYKKPAACAQADPDQPYCQILGKYRMTYPGYSTIPLYDHMVEHCPTEAPFYPRPNGC